MWTRYAEGMQEASGSANVLLEFCRPGIRHRLRQGICCVPRTRGGLLQAQGIYIMTTHT